MREDRAEHQFTVNGRRMRGTKEGVERALRGVKPEAVRRQAVEIGGARYPVKQAFAVAFGMDRKEFVTNTATRVLQRLGFEVYSRTATARNHEIHETHERGTAGTGTARNEGGGVRSEGTATASGVRPRFPYTAWMPKAAEAQRLDMRAIELRWSEWHRWEDLEEDDRGGGGVEVPDGSPGVYEAKVEGQEERLTIGRASDLRARVKQGLIRGNRHHPAGEKIRKSEDTAQVRVRWAVTDRPGAAEEELHKQHVREFGRLPKYTGHT